MAGTATTTAIFEPQGSLVTRDLAGEKVIVPVRGKVGDLSCIYTLNAVANEIWGLLDGKRTIAEIISELGKEYEVEENTLVADVMRVLDEMSQEGLVQQKV
jgi:hypothetical protein